MYVPTVGLIPRVAEADDEDEVLVAVDETEVVELGGGGAAAQLAPRSEASLNVSKKEPL